jgi:hypothetical protein
MQKVFSYVLYQKTDKIELIIYCKVARHDINVGYHLRKDKLCFCVQTDIQTGRLESR